MPQTPLNTAQLRSVVQAVCTEQVQLLQRKDSRLRYRIRRDDKKGETLRDQIESHDGSVARLLQHNGQPLTAEEQEGEQGRLRAMLGTSKLQQREHDEARNRSYGVELLKAFPGAMRFRLASQQNVLSDVSDKQIVLDFESDPEFHPDGLAQQVLTQLSGRLWIDQSDRHLLRIELHNVGEVNLAWGLLIKIHTGGTVLYEQRKFLDQYVVTRIAIHLRMRELMVKTAAMDTDTAVFDVQRMPDSPTGDAAIRMLLAEKVPTR